MIAIKNKLLALLAVQIFICLVVGFQQYKKSNVTNMTSAMFNENIGEATKILIEEDGRSITLNKKASQWQFDSNNESVNVDKNKIDQLLESFKGLKKTFPVATTSEAASRFEVARDKYKRRISIGSDKELQVFYLGTSPMFKKVNFRKDDEDEIFEVALNANDVSSDMNEWLDKNSLWINDDVTAIQSDKLDLFNQNGAWQLMSAGSTEKISNDKSAVEQYVNHWRTLTLTGMVEDISPFTTMKPNATIKINTQSKIIKVNYFVYDNKHVVQIDAQKNLFLISEEQAKTLFEVSLDSLMAKESAPNASNAPAIDPTQSQTGLNSVLLPSPNVNP